MPKVAEVGTGDGRQQSELTATGYLACIANALSSPTRLKILKLVQEEELCVCELAAILEVSQPAVSQHLMKLRQAGLAVERRAGQMALYSAAAAGELVLAAVRAWLELAIAGCAELDGWTDRLAGIRLRRACVEPESPACKADEEVRDGSKW